VSPIVTPTLADQWAGMSHMASGWMWFWGTLVTIALAATVVAVVMLMARTSRAAVVSCDDGVRRARAIVMERYARGEITAAEYHELYSRLR
jgi:uncharacterized membrane protein